MDLNAFLDKFVEGYLFGDLETMKNATPLGNGTGAVGYPLLVSTFSGIELLGALVSTTKFNPYNGSNYFNDFWENYLYAHDPIRGKVGRYIYVLARHGLAHSFVMKGDITIVKNMYEPHLVKVGSTVYINTCSLAIDLKYAYDNKFKILTSATTGAVNGLTIKDRLDEMESEYISQSSQPMNYLLANLPTGGPSGAISSSVIPQGVSGAPFPAGYSQQSPPNIIGPSNITNVSSSAPFKK
jgi:hypothetical protein